MKTVLKVVGVLFGVVLLAAVGVYAWASFTASRLRGETFDPQVADFPIPFPLDPAEVSAMGLSDEAAHQLAVERAVARGKHLIAARYVCTACHSPNFGGGVMVDSFAIGHLLAPNLTLGVGSRTANFQAHDWDRIVRHGVRQDGRPAVMPADDFMYMSDEELSDIVSYIRSLPPVDNTVPQSTLGPVGTVLVAVGKMQFSAPIIAAHPVPRLVRPPDEAVNTEFGQHLATACRGCHGPDFSGGPIAGGDPSWPPAKNLTPDATGLKGWTYDQFVTALAQSREPDGTMLREPMTLMASYGQSMTDVERHAIWAFLQSLPPVNKMIPK